MKWITRERPKIDRIACPWLIARFIDADAEFLYVPTDAVFRRAEEIGAIPYDIPGAELSHDGEFCSFDAFLRKYALADPALLQLAAIVRGADTSRLDLTPQSPGQDLRGDSTYRAKIANSTLYVVVRQVFCVSPAGLYAISLGLSHNFTDDQEMLRHGLVMYDALYAWCQHCQNETHHWPPKM